MKSILLIRHAKSSWDFNVEDFDRPLNERGKKAAPEMANRLLKKDIKIDVFISSPALRALTTAKYFADVYKVNKDHIIEVDALYEPTSSALENAIKSQDDAHETIALFSHNPGITEFAARLSATRIDEMPTCAIFAIKAAINGWSDFKSAGNEFWFFDYPKSGL